MIRYALKCSASHDFESWFANAEAFDKLKAADMVACPDCGSTQVSKSLMAPRVRPARGKALAPAKSTKAEPGNGRSEVETRLAELKKHVESTSDYVGVQFAAEARKMHDGDIPHRSIYGEARLEDARRLVEDGVPIAPLPFRPTRKSN